MKCSIKWIQTANDSVEHGIPVHFGYILAEGTNGEEQSFVFLSDISPHLGKPVNNHNKQIHLVNKTT